MKNREAEGETSLTTQPPNHLTIAFTPIGYVENDFDAPTTPEIIAVAESRVVVASEFVEGLTGLEAGQQVMIVFHLWRNSAAFTWCKPMPCSSIRGEIAPAPSGACSPCTHPIAPIPCGATVPHRGDRGGSAGGGKEHVAGTGAACTATVVDALNGTPVLDIKLV